MSGVIYGAIVVMWLAFLVPMWLKRHDQAPEPKPVERATIAMRVLSRRTHVLADGESPVTAGVAAPMPDYGRFEDSDAAASGMASRTKHTMGRLLHLRRRPKAASTVDGPVARRSTSAAARRRRILGTLLALTLVLAVLAALSRVPWLAVAPAGALLAGYVALLAVHGHRAARSRRQAPDAVGVGTAAVVGVSHTAIEAETSYYEDETTTFPAVGSSVADGRFADDLSLQTLNQPVGAAAPDGFAGPRLGWDPVPVPSPTYVHAPRAPRAVRSIDLSRDGAWTSGRLVADAKAAAAAAVARSSDQHNDGELARHAVGD